MLIEKKTSRRRMRRPSRARNERLSFLFWTTSLFLVPCCSSLICLVDAAWTSNPFFTTLSSKTFRPKEYCHYSCVLQKTRRRLCESTTTRLYQETQDKKDDENFTEERNIIKMVAGSAASGIMGVAKGAVKGGRDVAEAAKKGGRGVGTAALKGGRDIAEVALKGGFDVAEVALKSGRGVQSVTKSAASGIVGLAEQGGKKVQSAAQTTLDKSGQVAQWMDTRAKEQVTTMNSKTKEIVLQFTGKPDYQVGDITKELLRRAATANVQDLILLLKVLLMVGASFGPLAKTLPLAVLLESLNVSLEERVGGKIVGLLAGSLDDRFQVMLGTDTQYQLGDLAKRTLVGAILGFTGKEKYEPGDIERAAVTKAADDEETTNIPPLPLPLPPQESVNYSVLVSLDSATSTALPTGSDSSNPKTLELNLSPEFEEWDTLFRENHPDVELAISESFVNTQQNTSKDYPTAAKTLDMKIARELEEWDNMFREQHPDS